MKKYTFLFLLLVAGCRDKNSSIEPVQLVGTWNTTSTVGKPYSRWTFLDDEYLYIVTDSLKVCTEATGQPYKYWIEKDTLVVRYVGISIGLFPIKDSRYYISLTNPTKFTLTLPDSQRKEFERCP